MDVLTTIKRFPLLSAGGPKVLTNLTKEEGGGRSWEKLWQLHSIFQRQRRKGLKILIGTCTIAMSKSDSVNCPSFQCKFTGWRCKSNISVWLVNVFLEAATTVLITWAKWQLQFCPPAQRNELARKPIQSTDIGILQGIVTQGSHTHFWLLHLLM